MITWYTIGVKAGGGGGWSLLEDDRDMVKLASFVLHIEIDYFVHVTYFSRELSQRKEKETCDLYYTGLLCVCVFWP